MFVNYGLLVCNCRWSAHGQSQSVDKTSILTRVTQATITTAKVRCYCIWPCLLCLPDFLRAPSPFPDPNSSRLFLDSQARQNTGSPTCIYTYATIIVCDFLRGIVKYRGHKLTWITLPHLIWTIVRGQNNFRRRAPLALPSPYPLWKDPDVIRSIQS